MTSTTDTKLRVEGLTKKFGRITAVDNVTLDIKENEIFGLLGDNGAGKSTLMNILSGVYPPTEGAVYYDGESVSFDDPSEARDRGIETVYQDLALMDDLDIATNIFMGQFPKREPEWLSVIDWPETYARTEEIVSESLAREMDPAKEVEFLSGGQRQLVAVARALAFDPEVIILDEPTSALSAAATELVHETIRRLREEGRTIVIVSHNLENALSISDRVGVLFQGELVDSGSVDQFSVDYVSELMVSGTPDAGITSGN